MINNAYGLYKESRDASWQVLIQNRVNSLPVNISKICTDMGISIIKNSAMPELQQNEFGISIFDNDKWYIIYDDNVPVPQARYTIAHELGHMCLGHPLTVGYHARTIDKKSDVEYQADRFAISLLAPACVLWGLDIHTPEEIMNVCNISYTAAKIRANRMDLLYKRNAFLTSPLERQVYENFIDFINKNKPS